MPKTITIKQLHGKTGDYVREAGASRSAWVVTDRGEPVAVLGNPDLLKAVKRRRTLLPAYAVMMSRSQSTNVIDDLNAVRGDR